MKTLLLFAAFILLITTVKAQDTGTAEPKVLTCTEMAFNFSFRIGQKFNFSEAKFGSVEATTYQTDLTPYWAMRANAVKPAGYQPSPAQTGGFKVVDNSKDLFPVINFNPFALYPLLNVKPLKPFSGVLYNGTASTQGTPITATALYR